MQPFPIGLFARGPTLRTASPYNRVATNRALASGNSIRIAGRYRRYIGSGDMKSLRVRLDNIAFKSDTTVAGYGNAVTVIAAYLEWPALGLSRQLTYHGQTSWSIPDGQYDVYTDQILPSVFSQASFPRLTTTCVRLEVEVADGMSIPVQEGTDTGSAEGNLYNPAVTTCTNLSSANIGLTFSGTAPSTSFGLSVILVGEYATGTDPRCWLLAGDSIFANGNAQSYGTYPMYHTGSALISAMQVGRGGGQSTVQTTYPAILGSFTKLCNGAVEEYGTNNVTSSLATLQTLALASWAFIRGSAIPSPAGTIFKIVRPYLLLKTTGTWATLAGQTIVADWDNAGKVDQLNAWYLTQVGVGNGPDVVFDPREGGSGSIRGAATSADPDYWKWGAAPFSAVMTSDGLHPGVACAAILGGNLAAVLPA